MVAFAPKAQLTAIIDNWDGYYVERAKAVADGTWTSGDTWGGLNTGMVEMAPYSKDIPAEVVAKAEAAEAAIKAGTLHPFQGPITGQDGTLKATAGETLSDEVLLGMDWYVEGVEGSIPK